MGHALYTCAHARADTSSNTCARARANTSTDASADTGYSIPASLHRVLLGCKWFAGESSWDLQIHQFRCGMQGRECSSCREYWLQLAMGKPAQVLCAVGCHRYFHSGFIRVDIYGRESCVDGFITNRRGSINSP